MFILRPIRLLSSDSTCSICCSYCAVSVHMNMSSAKRRLERNYPSIFTPLFSQFNLLNMLSNVDVNSLGEATHIEGFTCNFTLTHPHINAFALFSQTRDIRLTRFPKGSSLRHVPTQVIASGAITGTSLFLCYMASFSRQIIIRRYAPMHRGQYQRKENISKVLQKKENGWSLKMKWAVFLPWLVLRGN